MRAELVERGDRLIVSAPYNAEWRAWANTHGGRWDLGSKAWVVALEQREAVEEALTEIFGGEDDE